MSYDSVAMHSTQALVFCLFDGDEAITKVQFPEFVGQLAGLRSWLLGPPELVEIDLGSDEPGEALTTVGALLEIYDSEPPLLPAAERRQFEDVEAMVFALRDFSSRTGVMYMVELDGDQLGTITKGVVSRGLQDMLLEDWRKSLDRN